MQHATVLIDSFIKTISESDLLSSTCQAIRAYEAKNLPVPIKKTYFSFSAAENKFYYTRDDEGNITEVNSIKIAVNCFIPLKTSPAVMYTLAETVLRTLMSGNENITGITVGKTGYDSDVDAFKISGEIVFMTEKHIT